jgi:hypothetical protein
MTARIYKPAKTAMQSGRAKTHLWVLDFDPKDAQHVDPLMGWAGSADTEGQVTLRFDTLDEAVAYAKKLGLDAAVTEPQVPTLKLKAYADNFSYNRIR